MKENCIEWITGDKIATVTFSQQKFINLVLKLSETDTEAVEIIKQPETNGGYLVAHIDIDRVQIRRKPKLSDDARNRRAEQLKRNLGH